jgi:3',5'-cyclic AMP phosphodiesterase CpdA
MPRVLQIIHVTDLHVGSEGVGAEARLRRDRSRAGLLISQHLQRNNLLRWQEGMQTHFHYAPQAFEAFLEDARASEPEWFEETPTWIVDTGDLTTFGDEASIREGKQFLKQWADMAGAAATREIYGNHDAWPECQPFMRPLSYERDLNEQRSKLTGNTEWQPQRWLEPLRARIPIEGPEAYIELYALDSVGWDGLRNGRAVGSIDPREITTLQERIEERRTEGYTRDYRILATHHPVVYPYEAAEVRACGGLVDQMRLANAGEVARRLSARERTSTADPYVHLIMSGHIHVRYPGGPFDNWGRRMRQKGLDGQLQLVGSSLMLNRHAEGSRPSQAGMPDLIERVVEGFDPVSLDPHTCQADILRFSVKTIEARRPGERHVLILERVPVVAVDGTEYAPRPARAQTFTIEL